MAGTNWQSEVRIQALVDTDTSHHPSSCRLYFGWELIFNMLVWLYFGINVHHILRKYLFPESDLYRTGWHSLWKTLFSQKCSPTYCIGVSFPLESIWEGFSQCWYFIFLKKSYILVDQYFPDYFSKLWNVISYILPVGVLCTLYSVDKSSNLWEIENHRKSQQASNPWITLRKLKNSKTHDKWGRQIKIHQPLTDSNTDSNDITMAAADMKMFADCLYKKADDCWCSFLLPDARCFQLMTVNDSWQLTLSLHLYLPLYLYLSFVRLLGLIDRWPENLAKTILAATQRTSLQTF